MLETILKIIEEVAGLSWFVLFVRSNDTRSKKEKLIFYILSVVMGTYGIGSIIYESIIKGFNLNMILTLCVAIPILIYGVVSLIKQKNSLLKDKEEENVCL